MTFRRTAMYLSYSMLGILALTGASVPQTLADDGRTQAIASKHHEPEQKSSANELVRVVREATARYRDVEVAKADGYELHFGCVTDDDGGAMGLHYVKMDLVGDGKLDVTRPEIVIYEPLPNGRLRLIGADYLVLAEHWDAAHDSPPFPPPDLMGQLFHYFESPNRFRLPPFYTLHVWAWKDNPSGTFTNWHTKVSCDAFEGQGH